jgi:signal transduction histidine kinase
LLEARLAQLPSAARKLAVGAALWGDAAPLDALAYASGLAPQAFRQARDLLTEAGLVHLDGDRLRYAHDRLRAAVRDGLEAELGRDTARTMAERLAESDAPAGDPLHAASLRLRMAAGLEAAEPSRWRDRFAQGAQAARARADPVAADTFAEAAWTLHGRAPAEGDALELIGREAVLAAVDRRDRAAVDERLRIAREIAVSPAARGRAIRLALVSYKLLGDVDAGWEVARAGLASLGLKGPWTPTPAVFLRAVAQYRLSRLVPLPRAREVDVEPMAQIGEAAGHLIYERSPATAALIAIRIAARIGPRPESFFTAIDAFVHAAIGDRRRAAALGTAAVASMDASGDGDAGSLYRALYFGAAWTRRIAALRERSDEIRDRALAEGDVVNAARTVRNHAGLGFRCVPSLQVLDAELEADARQLLLLGDEEAKRAVAHLRALVALLRHPRGREQAKARMTGFQASPPSDWLPEIEVASVWGDWTAAARIAELGRAEKGFHDIYPGAVAWRFHEQLANMKCGRRPSAGDLRRVHEAAQLNPADQCHRWLGLRAEQLRLRGRHEAAVSAYASALEAAEASEFRLEAGVIAMCARDAARSAGHADQADRFAERASAIWRAWGAVALSDQADPAPEPAALEAAHALAESADRASRAKSRLLADVAHELRTPLQGMQGLLDLAAEDGRALDLPALSGVLASLKTVVDDLGEYAAMSSGGAALTVRPVALVELVRGETALAGSLPSRRCTGFEVVVGDDVPALVDSDGARVRQVVRNLLSNACKYGGGLIRVQVRREDGSRARWRAEAGDHGRRRGRGALGGRPVTLVRAFRAGRSGRVGDRSGRARIRAGRLASGGAAPGRLAHGAQPARGGRLLPLPLPRPDFQRSAG